ncbi:MAG: membrane dipeptidase [Chloroflexota bacterium]
MSKIIVDAHLDLAYSHIENGRNLFLQLDDLREYEKSSPSVDGIATVTFPELRKGQVGLVFASIFACPPTEPCQYINYHTPDQAYSVGLKQLDYYHRLADENQSIRLVGDTSQLQEVLDKQNYDFDPETESPPLLGIVPMMEGADPVRDPAELEEWWERGLRIVAPAWDDTRYAKGAWRKSTDGFSKAGYALMEVMTDIGFILDITHLNEPAANQALERYEGHIIASHSNSKRLAPHIDERNLTDRQVHLLGERGGVIGIALYNRFLKKNHVKGERKELVTLEDVVAHIDHYCQLLGSADHVGIGSDLDGGFGYADIPAELNSVADLAKIGEKLAERGYEPADVNKVMGENWVSLLQRAWS